MSTRSTASFVYPGSHDKPEAIIYRHSDGYPEAAGVDLKRFIQEVSELPDSRFSDPSYLAAKYVVWLAGMFNKYGSTDNPMDFISVGVVSQNPGDIEYRYVVECNSDFGGEDTPEVTCYDVYSNTEVPIP